MIDSWIIQETFLVLNDIDACFALLKKAFAKNYVDNKGHMENIMKKKKKK